jgi:coenzyme F420-reducing hydrogenase beta subunit
MYPSFLTTNKSEECSACSACGQICKVKAITMTTATDGFLYPSLNKRLCTECGLCGKVCPANNEFKKQEFKQKVFYAWSNNDTIRLDSSSGGLFSEIAHKILEMDGSVWGAAYDENMNTVHIEIESMEQLDRLKGSKYIQSNLQNTFQKAKSQLKNGRIVYFVGTPCQIDGLNRFLIKDYKNLITSDLICHGVPSNTLFKAQLKDIEELENRRIKNFSFRDKKRFGWGYDLRINFLDGTVKYAKPELLPFFYGFWNNKILRPSCYSCHYTTTNRVSDITLGDFWAIKKLHPKVKTTKGISLLLINSQKGQDILQEISNRITYGESTIDAAIVGQGQLKEPVSLPQNIKEIQKDLIELDFKSFSEKHLNPSIKERVKLHLKDFTKMILLYKHWK